MLGSRRIRAVCYGHGVSTVDARRLPVDGGGAVFCEVAGHGPPLVLTHDGILHRESWDAQFESLSESYRVVRWDRRGYGRSDEPHAPFASDEDLAQVIASLTDPPGILMGCSVGALLSLQCTLTHPELVAALVLVGPIVSGLDFTEHFISRGGHRPDGVLTTAEEIDYWSSADPWFIAQPNIKARDRLRALLTANPNNLRPDEDLEQAFVSPVLARLGHIAIPTLIIVGEYDIADVHAHSGAIEAGIPGARRMVLPKSGHMPHFEVPGEFNTAVLGFLTAQQNGPSTRLNASTRRSARPTSTD
ncbi:MAG TPA: alpha/beta hydrolase [Gemmataceae bacterium]|nr:alpha/beta hydrolase [Gemmataceae bacterium]